VQLRYLYS